jgi:hypothetical protein
MGQIRGILTRSRSDVDSQSTANMAPETSVTRKDRTKCWESRDAYFACLDAQGILYAGKEKGVCTSENARYHENCAKSWVCNIRSRTDLILH